MPSNILKILSGTYFEPMTAKGMTASAAQSIGKTVLKGISLRYFIALYVEVPQEKRQEIAAALAVGIIEGKKSIAKIPSPKPLTRCTNPAPAPTPLLQFA